MFNFSNALKKLFGIKVLSESFWDDFSDTLIEGDVGPVLAEEIVQTLRKQCSHRGINDSDTVKQLFKERMLEIFSSVQPSFPEISDSLSVILLLGVNGVGKTTTAAKLANYYHTKNPTESIIMAAGDTLRAAAIEQLSIHSNRLGLKIVAQQHGSDAGAVIFDALQSAKAGNAKLVIADTAGRMHTKQNLIKELAKIEKIITTQTAKLYRYLVIDATTGSNALQQARNFSEAITLNGLILTKFDSIAKGGILLTIAKELKLAPAFLCFGEQYGDIAIFSADDYLRKILDE